jgi:serine protease Do
LRSGWGNSVLRAFIIGLVLAMSTGAEAAEALPISLELAKVLERRYPQNVDELRLLETQVQKVATQAVPATVEVEIGQSIGSGVIISPEGLVLTAAHVIGGANRPATIVLADGRRLKGRTLGAHHEIDAGMVQIDKPPHDVPFVPVTTAAKVETGSWVVATGQPGGILDNRSPPVRLGRVLAQQDEWICTDCTLVGGDSGGPLFNLQGEVMAIHMSIGPAAIHNFHVPVGVVREFWEKMLTGEVWGTGLGDDEDGERVVLGIAGHDRDGHCEVTQVFPNFPAEAAGIKAGDVILRIGDTEVDSLVELTREILVHEPGDEVEIELRRGDEQLKMEVTLQAIENPLPGSVDPDEDDARDEESAEAEP